MKQKWQYTTETKQKNQLKDSNNKIPKTIRTTMFSVPIVVASKAANQPKTHSGLKYWPRKKILDVYYNDPFIEDRRCLKMISKPLKAP